ncbi:uncharacterized protein [Euwallacea fornicatus]|uniref:uncharacterized protein n=1 Tax=Euwallacea fornicatus TaxID=995702 RepID=UPI0033906DF7
MNVIACVFVVFIQASLVLSTLDICYFCNTEVHGEGCEEPINSESIQMQNCSVSDIVTNSNQYVSKVKHFLVEQNQIQDSINIKTTSAYNAVCIYMHYTFSGRNISARGCEIEFIDIKNEFLDICEYYRQIIPNRIENFTCAVCHKDFCNHRGYGHDGANVFSVSLSMLFAMLLARFYM